MWRYVQVASLLHWLTCAAAVTKGLRVRSSPDIPVTRFTCTDKPPGYYADVDTGCQVYHMCTEGGNQFTYQCPNTTLFQQRMLICAHWYQVNCSRSESHFGANLLIGQRDKPFVNDDPATFSREKQIKTLQNPDLLQHLGDGTRQGKAHLNSGISDVNRVFDSSLKQGRVSPSAFSGKPLSLRPTTESTINIKRTIDNLSSLPLAGSVLPGGVKSFHFPRAPESSFSFSNQLKHPPPPYSSTARLPIVNNAEPPRRNIQPFNFPSTPQAIVNNAEPPRRNIQPVNFPSTPQAIVNNAEPPRRNIQPVNFPSTPQAIVNNAEPPRRNIQPVNFPSTPQAIVNNAEPPRRNIQPVNFPSTPQAIVNNAEPPRRNIQPVNFPSTPQAIVNNAEPPRRNIQPVNFPSTPQAIVNNAEPPRRNIQPVNFPSTPQAIVNNAEPPRRNIQPVNFPSTPQAIVNTNVFSTTTSPVYFTKNFNEPIDFQNRQFESSTNLKPDLNFDPSHDKEQPNDLVVASQENALSSSKTTTETPSLPLGENLPEITEKAVIEQTKNGSFPDDKYNTFINRFNPYIDVPLTTPASTSEEPQQELHMFINRFNPYDGQTSGNNNLTEQPEEYMFIDRFTLTPEEESVGKSKTQEDELRKLLPPGDDISVVPPSIEFSPPREDSNSSESSKIELRFQDPRQTYFIPTADGNDASKNVAPIIVTIPLNSPEKSLPMWFRASDHKDKCSRCHPSFVINKDNCMPCVIIR